MPRKHSRITVDSDIKLIRLRVATAAIRLTVHSIRPFVPGQLQTRTLSEGLSRMGCCFFWRMTEDECIENRVH